MATATRLMTPPLYQVFACWTDPGGMRFARLPCYGTAVSDRTVVVLGTATPGGGFPVYGAAITEVINAHDPTLDVQPRNTKGSTENVPMLAAGTLDIAL